MRLRCVLALAFLLAGCTDSDWSRIMPGSSGSTLSADPAPAAAIPVNTDGVSVQAERKCRDAAKTRSMDVGVQGFDSDVQQAAYDKTYASCMYWAKRTGR